MWFFLSLYFALWTSLSTFILKRLTKELHPTTILLVGNVFILPFVIILILFLGGVPAVSAQFIPLVVGSSLIDIVAFFVSIYALKISPISLVSPISSFSPVLTSIFGILVLGEVPTNTKFVGILLIVLGAYLLNISDIKHGLLRPIQSLVTHRGVQLTFLAYFLWAITPLIQKQAILETHPQQPLFVSLSGMLLVTIFVLPFALRKRGGEFEALRKNLKWFLLIGPLATIAFWAAFTAFSLQNVGYVTAIFKLSVLFTILFGWLFFKETRIKERLLGAGVMLAGMMLLVV